MNTVPSRTRRTLALLLSLGFIYAVAFCSTRSFALSVDDFNDNAKDTSKWGTDSLFGNGVLAETNQRLEYTCASGTLDDNDIRPWVLTRFPYNADWEIQIDAFNGTTPSTAIQVDSAGIQIFSPDGNNALLAELYASSLVSPPARNGFYSSLDHFGVSIGTADSGGLPVTHGAVRMVFDSTTKVISVFYDLDVSDGYQWIQYGSFGITGAGGADANFNWALTSTDQISVAVYGYSQFMTVTSGQMFLDNFQEIGGVVPSGPPSPVPVGSFLFGFPTNNPLLTAIVYIAGHYQGVYPVGPHNYNVDLAEDETGKLAVMGTADGVQDASGNSEISLSAGAITTVSGKPTAQLNVNFTGTVDSEIGTFGSTAVAPLELVDIGGGTQGFVGTASYSANFGGMQFSGNNLPFQVTPPPEALDNLKKDWSIQIDVRANSTTNKKGKVKIKGQIVSAQLTLPNGDTIAFPEQTTKKYSNKKGFSLSFANGTNLSRNPPTIDTHSSIMVTGLKFLQQGGVWQPSAGTITYRFLGQQGTANLLDFVTP